MALLGVGLHPRLVPEAVKLTTLKLLGTGQFLMSSLGV